MNTPTNEPELLDYAQAARYLGIGTRSLRRIVDDGDLTAHRFGRAVRFKRSALDELIERAAIEPVGGRGSTSAGPSQ